MYKIIFILLLAYSSVQASFWGSLFGSALGGSGSTVIVNEKEALILKKNKKTQHALAAMKYYKGSQFNGNLNTFDSREAIEKFQTDLGYDTKYEPTYMQKLLGLTPTENFTIGILAKPTKENLVYQFELIDEFTNTKYKNDNKKIYDAIQSIIKRKESIRKATQINETRMSKNGHANHIVSDAMKNKILKNQKDLKKLQANIDIVLQSKKDVVIDTNDKLIWQDTPIGQYMSYDEAKKYCSKLSLNSLTYWRLPTLQEVQELDKTSKKTLPLLFKNLPNSTQCCWRDGYWIFIQSDEIIDINSLYHDRAYTNGYVKCVHDYQ